MLQPWQYELARYKAAFHVQVRIRHVQSNVRTPGEAKVEGEVVRVFRGQNLLRPADAVRFSVSVLTPADGLKGISIGGTIWANYAALQTAQYLEAFLDGIPPECGVALWQHAIIEEPTDRPTMAGTPSLALCLEAAGGWRCIIKRIFGLTDSSLLL